MSNKQPDGQNTLFIFVLILIAALTISIMPSDKDDQHEPTLMEMIPSVTNRHVVTPEPHADARHVAAKSTAGEASHAVVEHKAEVSHPEEAHSADTHVATAETSHAKESHDAVESESAKTDAHHGQEEEKAEATHEVPAADAQNKPADAHEGEEKATSHAAEEAATEPAVAGEEAPEKSAEAAPAGSSEVVDVIAMESAVYDKHKKDIVHFTHENHIEAYSISCGECHHDDSGHPLAELKMGDPVEKCSACHDKVGKAPKGISAAEKLEFHKEALHKNCIQCHKDHNKANNTKAAPASCKQCHAKGAAVETAAKEATAPAAEPEAHESKEKDATNGKEAQAATEEAGESHAKVEETPHKEDAATEEKPAAEKSEAHAPAAEAEKPAEAAAAPAETAAPQAAAGNAEVADIIAMESAVYEKHKKGIVQFSHKKHFGDYAVACGECHHDDKGQPLTELKLGEPVEKCSACHTKTGKAPKEASTAEKLEFHKEALHKNCIQCHKDFNKKNNTKAAPASCKQCHPKTKK